MNSSVDGTDTNKGLFDADHIIITLQQFLHCDSKNSHKTHSKYTLCLMGSQKYVCVCEFLCMCMCVLSCAVCVLAYDCV